ncbi:MAG TPA: hypothetical protein VJ785_02410 [Anaerolineales bacterium]|nr:hypothetical protein [Anaerolineales bacterium]
MPKQFYTEKDIEDLFQRGIKSLQVTNDIVLTELAYEKARRLGVDLISDRADNPPAAPVRPYLSSELAARAQPTAVPVSQAIPETALTPSLSQPPAGMLREEKGSTTAIENRIRSAVIAKLGDQVDAKLLDNIIHRVVKGIGLK